MLFRSVDLPEGIDWTNLPEGKNILQAVVVKDGLKDMLNDLAQQLLQIQPKQELIKRIKIQQGDITRRINESDVETIVGSVLDKLI